MSTATRRLWCSGRECHLTPKAFDLLALLVERRPEAVSKREIHDRLWPGTFVSDVTLHSLVSEVRRTLGDHASVSRVVRTIHGFGYAFIALVGDAPDLPKPARRLRGWLVGDGGRLSLFDGDNVLGRGAEGVIELPSSTVSRLHAAIRFASESGPGQAGEVWIEDLGSKNGTFLRDTPVMRPHQLADGDPVRFGSLVLTFRLAPAQGAASTQSMTTPTPPGRDS